MPEAGRRIEWRTVGPSAPRGGLTAEVFCERFRDSPALRTFLAEATASGGRVLLLVNDGHRSTQTHAAAAALATILGERGLDLRLDVIVATGTHGFSVAERADFGRHTFDASGLSIERVIWHAADDDASLCELAGVRLNRALAEHRFLLPIGSVEPHYFAGVTGAHKTATIGCMGRADIERNHSGALDPASDALALGGNPVHDGIARVIAGLVEAGKRICAVNELVVRGALIEAAIGDPLETLAELLPAVRSAYVHTIPAPVDLLVLDVPPPLGRNLYQADKALKNNHRSVRDGGGILLRAACPEGIGQDHFLRLLRRAPDYASAVELVRREGYRLGDHKAVKLRHLTDPKMRGVHIALVGANVNPHDASAAGLLVFRSEDDAVRRVAEVIGEPCRRGLCIDDSGLMRVTAR